MIDSYISGATVRVKASFRNAAGALVDPDAVVVRVRAPSGAKTTPVVVHDSLGTYHSDVPTSDVGTYAYRFEATLSGATSASESSFAVSPSAVL